MNQISRAYIVSHIRLRDEIFSDWNNFNIILNEGPDKMKEHLAKLWNDINPEDLNSGFVLTDKDRVIGVNDFDITMNHVGDCPVFYFIMPDPDSVQAQAKCVALALTQSRPRYFTMEISKRLNSEETYYIMGEWILKDNNFTHLNIGPIPNGTVANFASHVSFILNNNSKKEQ